MGADVPQFPLKENAASMAERTRQRAQKASDELRQLLAASAEIDRLSEQCPEKLPFSHFNVPPANYRAYLQSAKWRTIRARVLARDGGNCCLCIEPTTATEVHHRSYHPHVMNGKADDQLISLCRKCHLHIEYVHDGRATGKFGRKRTERHEAEARIEAKLKTRKALISAVRCSNII